MTYVKHVRHGRYDRLRRSRRFLAFLAAQATRLASSASEQAMTVIETAAQAATGTLTFGANAQAGETVSIGNRDYAFVTALSEAKASGVFTGSANPSNAHTLVIGSKTYTFQAVLTNVDGNIKIGADLQATLVNIKNAINASGGTPGTDYAAANTIHPTVSAVSDATTLTVTAKAFGVAGNAIATTGTAGGGSWGGVVLSGGVDVVLDEVKISGVNASGSLDALIAAINGDAGEGTTYSTGQVAHELVTAAAGDGDTMVVTAVATDASGNQIDVATDVTSASWDDIHLTGGVTQAFGPQVTATAHGYATYDGPFKMTAATTLPGPVVAADIFFVYKVDDNTLKLASSKEDIDKGAFISFDDDGTGDLKLKRAATSEGVFEFLRENTAGAVKAASDIDSLR